MLTCCGPESAAKVKLFKHSRGISGLKTTEGAANTSEITEVPTGMNGLPVDLHTLTELCGNEAFKIGSPVNGA